MTFGELAKMRHPADLRRLTILVYSCHSTVHAVPAMRWEAVW
jgi:hypothetical protein